MNPMYPNYPVSGQTRRQPSASSEQVGNISLASSIGAVALLFAVLFVLHHFGRAQALATGRATLSLALIAVVSGLPAIAYALPAQRRLVLTRVSLGFALLAITEGIVVPNFLGARRAALQRAQGFQALRAAENKVRHQAAARLNGSKQETVNLTELGDSLGRAAASSSGESAAALRSTQDFLRQVQSQQQTYEEASRQLTSANVLVVRTIEQRADIARRRAAVTNFLATESAFRDFIAQSELTFSNGLANAGIAVTQRDAAVKQFRDGFGRELPLLMEIRATDEQIANGMLSVLDLLDRNWGRWRYDERSGAPRFDDRGAMNQYDSEMAAIRQAGLEQAAAQRRLATVYTNTPVAWGGS